MLLHQDLAAVETKSLTEADSVATFTGIASTADKDLTDDIIEAGAFGEINPAEIVLLRDHDMRQVIGKWLKFTQNGKKLEVEGEIGLDFPTGLETYKLMKHGYIRGLSVGFRIKPGGIKWDDEMQVRKIKQAHLLECSIVSIPANPKARLANVKALQAFSRRDWREWLYDSGLSEDDVTVVMKHGLDALLRKQKNDDEPPEPKSGESKSKFMSRCLAAMAGNKNAMKLCAAAWDDGEPDDDEDEDKQFAALAAETRRLATILKGGQP